MKAVSCMLRGASLIGYKTLAGRLVSGTTGDWDQVSMYHQITVVWQTGIFLDATEESYNTKLAMNSVIASPTPSGLGFFAQTSGVYPNPLIR